MPNGNRINIGAYCGTAESSSRNVCEGDFDKDGDVEVKDWPHSGSTTKASVY